MTLQEFKKTKDYLICVDSDGCAMDTMDIKHFRCFGPCMVEEWGLEAWKDEILERWNVINLYSMTRGINRFKGLNMMLTEVNEKYTPIAGVSDLTAWVNSGAAPSNAALQKAIDETGSGILKKALSWSKAVNASIVDLPELLKQPFPGAKEGLAAAAQFANVAIVSSANRDAVVEEWTKFKLLDHVDV
ncbi:MAG: HAD family hydrolase, partial [Oscillospiraceae bacterium]|nr:HAD family hydrolase [Oscillospiraceae bacterium]